MTFLPEKMNLKQAYKYIDNMFQNWFSKSYITLDKVIYYFPNLVNFSGNEILYAMMWQYYNYPIDWLDFKYSGRLGDTVDIRLVNLYQLRCFLQAAGKSEEEIKKIVTTLLTGIFHPSNIEIFLKDKGKLTMADFIKRYPASPFNDKRVLQLIKQRNTAKTMFQDDTELLVIMDTKVANIINTLRAKKEQARQKLREEAARKQSHIRRGHKEVEDVIFSEEAVSGKPIKGILRVKKNVVKTPEEVEAARLRREKILKKRAKAIAKAQRREQGEASEEEEFKEYTGDFLF